MLLRNYDNIIAMSKMGFTLTDMQTDGFGDGILSVKSRTGVIVSNYATSKASPFSYFTSSNTNYTTLQGGQSNLICGYDESEITYDTYEVGTIPNLTGVTHSSSDIVYDEETNTYTREYSKIYSNNTSNPVTINYIGVLCSISNALQNQVLIYKEKLPEPVEIPAYGSITLKFKTLVSGTPNKPADYVATASVE